VAINFAPLVTTPDVVFINSGSNTQIAKIVGDLNGDNIDDIIIAEHEDSYAWVIFGSQSWTRNTFNVSSDIVLGNGIQFDGNNFQNVERGGNVWGKPGSTALIGNYEFSTMVVTDTIFNTLTYLNIYVNADAYTFYFAGGESDYIGSAGDVNNDGYDDVLNSDTWSSINDVTLILGSPSLYSGASGYYLANAPQLSWPQEWLGYCAGVGDVNDDGYADFIITAPYTKYNATGQAYLLYGSPTAFTDLDGADLSLQSQKGVLIKGLSYSGNLGTYVKAVGDVNGDGYDDFIITAPATYADYYGGPQFAGKAFLLYGSATYFSKSAFKTLNLETDSWRGATFYASEIGDLFGTTVNAADINGDSLQDLLFGAPKAQGGKGRIYLLYGSTTPWSGLIDVTTYPSLTIFEGETILTGLGYDIGLGDFNRDGYIDVLAGLDIPEAHLFFGIHPSPTSSVSLTPSISISRTPRASSSSTPSPSPPPSFSRTPRPRLVLFCMLSPELIDPSQSLPSIERNTKPPKRTHHHTRTPSPTPKPSNDDSSAGRVGLFGAAVVVICMWILL